MKNGGVERYVMNLYRHIDREKVQFDFLMSESNDGWFGEEIKLLGGRIYHVCSLTINPIKHCQEVTKIVRENNYNIVHRHTGNAIAFLDIRAAKKGGAKVCILHSHNPQAGKPVIHYISKVLFSTDCIRFACSKESAEFLFGKREDYQIRKNAINIDDFIFSKDKRETLRCGLNIDNKLVIGHIGRFERQKNHKMLVDIFNEIHKRVQDSVLVCIGDGELFDEIKNYCSKLGLEESVLMLGSRNDVNEIINVFDVFLFPSIYEGFGITLIENQANGLKCFASKDKVPIDANIANNVIYISLEEPAVKWSEKILETSLNRDFDAIQLIRKKGYDIKDEAKRMQNYYLQVEKEENNAN